MLFDYSFLPDPNDRDMTLVTLVFLQDYETEPHVLRCGWTLERRLGFAIGSTSKFLGLPRRIWSGNRFCNSCLTRNLVSLETALEELRSGVSVPSSTLEEEFFGRVVNG